jgi:hypothetical protein
MKKYCKKGIVLNVVLQAAIQGALVYVWTQAVPTLIRPVYTWQGTFAVPPIYAIQPLQEQWLSLVLSGIFLGALRIGPEYLALRSSAFPQYAKRLQTALDPLNLKRRRHRHLLPKWVFLPFKAAFFTLILSGIISTWVEALFLAAILAFIMVEREFILPKFTRWTRWISRVPIIIRLAICAAITYYIGSQILVAVWNNQFAPLSSSCFALGFIPCEMISSSSNTFLPIVVSMIFSLIIASIILPRQPEKSEEVRSDQRNQ